MEITKKKFRAILLISVWFPLIGIIAEFLPVFNNYEILEEQLNQGFLFNSLNIYVFVTLFSLVGICYIASIILLYLFKPIGRLLYVASLFLFLIIIMFAGDNIEYSLLYPIEYVGSFLEIFIIYVIYLTPIKEEFKKA
jgi:hypothetical protein